MPGLVSVEIKGKERVLRGLAAFQETAKDLRQFWREVFAPRYFADVQATFESEGQGRWPQLSSRYAKWKARHYPGRKLLVLTGGLKASVRWSGGRIGPGGVFVAERSFALAGTSLPHGAAHQKGVRQRNLPARPFLHTPSAAVFAPLLRQWIVRTAKGKRL